VAPVDVREWRVPWRTTAVKAVAAAAFTVPVFTGDAAAAFLAGVVAVGCAALAARDLLAPVRLAADAGGVTTVSGFAGTRRLAWHDVERIRVDTHRRYGFTTETLEIDTGEQVHLFSRHDLGESPVDAAETLMRLRP
jgi:hypothetical protein